MKANEFIKEDVSSQYRKEWESIIKRDCKPFLRHTGFNRGYNLFRGMRASSELVPVLHKQVRLSDRVPKDTEQGLHDHLNKYFTKEYGHPYRNGLFVTGNQRATTDYGSPYVIFPIGDFEFIWSNSVLDLFDTWERFLRGIELDDPRLSDPDDVSIYEEFIHDILDGNYKDTDLISGINSGSEVMIWCKEYYAVDVDEFTKMSDSY